MESENIETQLKKGLLEFCILKIISAKEMYAGEIIEALMNADLIVVEGTVYPLLSRIKNEKLVDYKWVESKSGPPRKYYEITENGIQKLELYEQAWQKISHSINLLKNK